MVANDIDMLIVCYTLLDASLIINNAMYARHGSACSKHDVHEASCIVGNDE